jgi:flagellar hook-associated protein 2
MTTTSSTTSTPSTQSALATAGGSILSSLGAGSGIDTTSLVSNLVTATFADRESALSGKQTANTAQISALGSLNSGISSFSSALKTLIAGGTLKSQPSSSNSSILTVKATGTASISNLSASLEVRQLAQAQTLASAAVPVATPQVGEGSLTLKIKGGTTFNIALTAPNNTIDDLATAINAANTGTTPSGVTASVITDASGKRLVLKGQMGGANTFSLTANPDANPALSNFAFDSSNPTANPNMTLAQQAQNATIRMDGVDSSYGSNTVTDLIPGASLSLVSAQPGTTITLGVTRPTDALSQAVSDFVDAYNELNTQLAAASASASDTAAAGALHGTPAVREMQRQLRTITSATLTTLPNGPQTLAEIGVATKQDGTLTVDTDKLAKALATYPDSVEAMFNPGQRSSDPNLQVTSAIGATKPGTYTVTNITLSPLAGTLGVTGHQGANGMPDATPFLPAAGDASGLTAMTNSIAPGLTLHVTGNVASATITIDAGLMGVLQGISDDLLRNNGPNDQGALIALNTTLTAQTKSLTSDRDKLTTQETTYSDQLTKQFTAMQSAVSSYKSIQSFMTQQIASWSNKN